MNTVSFQMTLDEHSRISFRRKILRPRIITWLVIVAACGIFLLFCGSDYAFIGFVAILFCIFFPVRLYYAIRRILKKCAWFTALTTLTYSELGIAVVAPDYRSELGWRQFRSWSQTDGYFFLFLDEGNIAVTIPKRAFDGEQMQIFLSYVTRIGA